MTVFVVEDDEIIQDSLRYSLVQAGYAVTTAGSVREALGCLERGEPFDLCLLDIRLPDGSGFQVCDAIRARGSTPILFLTACDDEVNTVRALETGGDDYIPKPFRVRELLARMGAVLRRSTPGQPGAAAPVLVGANQVDLQTGKVYRNGQEVVLTAMEYKLLLVFLRNRGQLLSRGQILNQLWDAAGDYVNDNTLTVYVKRLREKLGDGVIQTVRGIGYRLG
ncbi:MAG: response regulator transcription factor [Ruminiclostridium sp.]|jgi:DNA-binding response OmpR family regulator|nr:response regulator transcription factor [Ruminiclostridium sp.]